MQISTIVRCSDNSGPIFLRVIKIRLSLSPFYLVLLVHETMIPILAPMGTMITITMLPNNMGTFLYNTSTPNNLETFYPNKASNYLSHNYQSQNQGSRISGNYSSRPKNIGNLFYPNKAQKYLSHNYTPRLKNIVAGNLFINNTSCNHEHNTSRNYENF